MLTVENTLEAPEPQGRSRLPEVDLLLKQIDEILERLERLLKTYQTSAENSLDKEM